MYRTSEPCFPCLHCLSVYQSMSSTPHPQEYDGWWDRGRRERDREREIKKTKSIRRQVALESLNFTMALEIVIYMERHFHLYCVYCWQIQELPCQSSLSLFCWGIRINRGTWISRDPSEQAPTSCHSFLTPSPCHLNKAAKNFWVKGIIYLFHIIKSRIFSFEFY